jgi:hypothetical protein
LFAEVGDPPRHAPGRSIAIEGGPLLPEADALSVDGAFRGAAVDGVAARELRFGLTWAIPIWEVSSTVPSSR